MKHPDKAINENQEQFLRQCSPDEREFHARMFRLGNAAVAYHRQALEGEHPTLADFEHWLEGLPDNIRHNMEKKGFEECKTHLPFTRHVMERRDLGMDEWMKVHLSEKDYQLWKQLGQ